MSNLTINLTNVQETLVSGTNIKTINGSSLLGAGNIQIDPLSVGTSGQIPYVNGTDDDLSYSSNLTWDSANSRLGIGTTSPTKALSVVGDGYFTSSIGVGMSPLGGSYGISTRGDVSMRFTNLYFRAESTNQVIAQIGVQGSDLGIFELKNSGTTHTRFRSSNSFLESSFIIGDSTTPTAKFQVKGSGSTSATTNLLLRNSSGTDLFKVLDDGATTLNGTIYINGGSSSNIITGLFSGNKDWVSFGTASSKFLFTNSGNILSLRTSGQQFRILPINGGANAFRVLTYYAGGVPITIQGVTSQTGNLTEWWDSNSNTLSAVNADGSLGIGTTTPSARLQVKGSGSTSATTTFLLQNASGTDLLKVLDDASVTFGGTLFGSSGIVDFGHTIRITRSGPSINFATTNNAVASGFTFANSTGSTVARIYHTPNTGQMDFWPSNGGAKMTLTVDGLGLFTTSPDASSILDLTSTTKGFLPPRMTTTERDAIATPATGLVIYNTTTNVLNFYNGSSWAAV